MHTTTDTTPAKTSVSFYAETAILERITKMQSIALEATGFKPSRSIIIAKLVKEALDARDNH